MTMPQDGNIELTGLSTNIKSGQFITAQLYADPKEVQNVVSDISSATGRYLFSQLSKKIQEDIPSILQAENFLGEAEEYMRINNIPFTPEARQEYAECIYASFLTSLQNDAIVYKEQTNELFINPYIMELEFGSYYRPALQYISLIIQSTINQLNDEVSS